LNTQMKICRGSGVLVKLNNDWKIKQYVLSMTIPNEQVDTIVSLKSALETPLIEQLKR
jgi:SnoaL-like domain